MPNPPSVTNIRIPVPILPTKKAMHTQKSEKETQQDNGNKTFVAYSYIVHTEPPVFNFCPGYMTNLPLPS